MCGGNRSAHLLYPAAAGWVLDAKCWGASLFAIIVCQVFAGLARHEGDSTRLCLPCSCHACGFTTSFRNGTFSVTPLTHRPCLLIVLYFTLNVSGVWFVHARCKGCCCVTCVMISAVSGLLDEKVLWSISWSALLVTEACGPTACAELLAQLIVSVLVRIEDYSLNYLCMVADLSKYTGSNPHTHS